MFDFVFYINLSLLFTQPCNVKAREGNVRWMSINIDLTMGMGCKSSNKSEDKSSIENILDQNLRIKNLWNLSKDWQAND